jgi:hypothetical protein
VISAVKNNFLETNLQTVNTRDKSTKYLLFVFGILIFSYTAARAYLLSITWDEAYSYLEFVRNGIFYPQQYNTMSANNHLLYSWLEIQFLHWFGVNELVLRLPSLFAHVLFLFYSAKLVINFNNRWLVFVSFFIINLNPYLLDFFSMARGYGLSLGLMMTSIYYLYAFTKDHKNMLAVCSIFFASLGVLANYVLLNYCLALFGTLFLLIAYNIPASISYSQKIFIFLKKIAAPVIIFSILLGIVIPIAFKLKEANALFFGGSKSFWSDTFSTITDRCFYELGYNYWFQRFAKGFVILIIMTASVFFLFQFIKKNRDKKRLFLGSLLFLIGLCVTSIIIQHYFLGTLYLMDRTALFLVVLFNLVLVFFIAEVSKDRAKLSVITYLSGVIVLIHFFASFNLKYVLEWKSNADTKEMLADLVKMKSIPKEKDNVSIGIPMEFDPSINFYRDVNDLTWLNTVCRIETTNTLQDYFYFSQDGLASVNKDSIEILKTYPGTKSVLAKPRYKYTNAVVCFNQELNFEQEPQNNYFIDTGIVYSRGFSYVINDSISPVKSALVSFRIKVMALDIQLCNMWMVVSLENTKGCYSWQSASIKDYIKKEGLWVNACFSVIIPSKAKAGDVLKAYIWNQNKHQLYVKEMSFKWIEYKF